jgi:hypothetical protein
MIKRKSGRECAKREYDGGGWRMEDGRDEKVCIKGGANEKGRMKS